MAEKQPADPSPSLQLPITDAGNVPVYDCHVILRYHAESGAIQARVSSLVGITAEGTAERDVLLKVVDRFKKTLQEYRTKGEAIPWLETPEKPSEGEQQRWIPVHL